MVHNVGSVRAYSTSPGCALFPRCFGSNVSPPKRRMNVGGASSFATSISTKAHLGHSNDRNPGVLLTSFTAARQLGQLFSASMRHENRTRTRVNGART